MRVIQESSYQRPMLALSEDDIFYLSSPIPYVVPSTQDKVGIHIGIGNRTEVELRNIKTYFYLIWKKTLRSTFLCAEALDVVPARQSFFCKIRLLLPSNLDKGAYEVRYTLSPGNESSDRSSGIIALEIE